MSPASTSLRPMPAWMSAEAVRTGLVAMVFITSFLSKFEPSPCDLFFAAALLFSLKSGLRLSATIMPLLLLLLIYNFSGIFSYLTIPYDRLDAKAYLLGLAYTSASGIFFAAYIAEDPAQRFREIVKAYWIGATIGSVLGLVSYFKIEPLYTVFPDYGGRAVGGYKDPNVFSTWLVFPFITMMQAFLLGTLKIRPLSVLSFLLILTALFLAFSRGAWINAVISAVLTIGLTYLASPAPALRGRIVIAGIIGVILVAIMLSILLSIPATHDLFMDRFTLVKEYDGGETGRFGNQLNAIPLLLERPLGFGPYQYAEVFAIAPHNTFLNSFSSAGWAGGISFILFIVCNFLVGFKTIFKRTPFQPYAIVSFSCLASVTVQGIQIDMEHWRHFYWMTGFSWGFFAASFAYVHRPANWSEVATVWNLPSWPARSRGVLAQAPG